MIALVAALQRLHRRDLPRRARGDPAGPARGGPGARHEPLRVFVQIMLPQATKIAIPNIGSMFIGMVKDTSVFTVIGLLEVVRVTQNMNSVTFQPFVLYTAAAVHLRDRRVRARLRLPGDREVALDAAEGPDRPRVPRAPARGGRAASCATPGASGRRDPWRAEDVARAAGARHGFAHGRTATTQGGQGSDCTNMARPGVVARRRRSLRRSSSRSALGRHAGPTTRTT